eukprot:5534943-Amphidinium_carterae.1
MSASRLSQTKFKLVSHHCGSFTVSHHCALTLEFFSRNHDGIELCSIHRLPAPRVLATTIRKQDGVYGFARIDFFGGGKKLGELNP